MKTFTSGRNLSAGLLLAGATVILTLAFSSVPDGTAPDPIVPQRTFTGPLQPLRLAEAEVLHLIETAAHKHNVPVAFVRSIVAAESGFNSNAMSPKGAIGLMQLMPATSKEYGADPSVPAQNVDAGTRYLRVLMDRYKRFRNPLTRVTAAYNAGPGMVERYRGVPPFHETQRYVVRVMAFMRHYNKVEKVSSNG